MSISVSTFPTVEGWYVYRKGVFKRLHSVGVLCLLFGSEAHLFNQNREHQDRYHTRQPNVPQP